MSISGIQGLPLEVTVVGCYNLEDKEWISRQDPYVYVEYGNEKFRTKTCTDGGKNPTFQEKFSFTLIEGLRELNVVVWNSRTSLLMNSLAVEGFNFTKPFPKVMMTLPGHFKIKVAGEVRLILHYSNANQSKTKQAPSVPTYATPSAAMTQILPYGSATPVPYPPTTVYSVPSPYAAYPPNSATYPPSPYPPTPPAGYPPQTHAGPPLGYPPQPYPSLPQASTYYPPGPPSGIYPPPPSSGLYPPPPPSGIYPPPPSGLYPPPPSSGIYPPPPY